MSDHDDRHEQPGHRGQGDQHNRDDGSVGAVGADQDAVTLFPDAARMFGDRVHGVPPEAWAAPTPCTEWTVRDLVNHLVSEHLWVPHLLRGETMSEVGDRYDGDVVGDDPVGAWDAACAQSVATWATLPGHGAEVSASVGRLPVRDYAEEMLLDLTVHTWDLARGAGLDERLEPAAVRHVLGYARAHVSDWQGVGIFAPPAETDSAEPRDQLLALLGRDPAYRP